jgi:hypothetical protein
MRSVPDSAVFLAGRLARLLDLPDAEELGREMDLLNPARKAAAEGEPAPEVKQLQQQLAAAATALRQAQAQLQDKAADRQLEAQKLGIEQFRAQTERMKAAAEAAGRPLSGAV